MPPKKQAKRRARKSQHGKGALADAAAKVMKIAKDTQIISKTLDTLAPNSAIAQTMSGVASQLGYGQRGIHAMHGNGFFDSLGSIASSIGHGIGSAGYGVLSGITGGGRHPDYRPVR